MWFLLLFIVGALVSFGLQRWLARKWVALIIPSTLFIIYGLASDSRASMWLVAVLLGFPVVFIGSVGGVLLAGKRTQK
jgi:hypothetical protein